MPSDIEKTPQPDRLKVIDHARPGTSVPVMLNYAPPREIPKPGVIRPPGPVFGIFLFALLAMLGLLVFVLLISVFATR